jgi:hypothetical protein
MEAVVEAERVGVRLFWFIAGVVLGVMLAEVDEKVGREEGEVEEEVEPLLLLVVLRSFLAYSRPHK